MFNRVQFGEFFKISFFPFWNGKFPAFSTGQVWSNCQAYKLQFIRTWMNKNRNKNTLGSNWWKKVRTLKLGKMLLVLFLKKSVHLCCWMDWRIRSQVFFKIAVLQNFAIFIKQHFINPTKSFSFLSYRNRYGWVKAMYKDTLA